MSRVEDLWERLVRAALRGRRAGGDLYGRHETGLATNVPSSLGNRNIDDILRAADEIQDPNVSRILCEHAYSLSQKLDPNSEGRGVLQFKTGLMSVFKHKLAKREGGGIDRSQDIARLREFYKLYRKTDNVDKLREEEIKFRLERKTVKRKRVLATLKVIGNVLEQLSKDVSPEEAERLIPEEEMPRVEDLWERLVSAALRGRRAGGDLYARPETGLATNVPSSLGNRNIDDILRAADEIQDPNVSIILCEHAYLLSQNLDPNSEGRGVLQFKTGLMTVFKHKLAKREGGGIDRSQDIACLREFYKLYRKTDNVDKLREEEIKLRLERKTVKRKRVLATLQVIGNVLEQLSKDVSPEEAERLIPEEEMPRVEDLWERLVSAALRGRRAGGDLYARPDTGLATNAPSSHGNRSILDILRAADEIRNDNPSLSRILCEHAYSLSQNLDPNSKGSGVLMFKAGLMSVIMLKLAKRKDGNIDRIPDIARVREFYTLYREKNNVDKLLEDEYVPRFLNTSRVSFLEHKRVKKKKRVLATLIILGKVLEQLTNDVSSEETERFIPKELRRVMERDAAMALA